MRWLALSVALACTPANYAKALDQCAFDHVGDREATQSCQCDVSKSYGRSCDWLGNTVTVHDGGDQ